MEEKMNNAIGEDSTRMENIDQVSFCPNCGEKLMSDVMYCPNCGTKKEIQVEDTVNTMNDYSDESATDTNNYLNESAIDTKSKKKKRDIIIIGSAVAVSAIIVVVLLILTFAGKTSINGKYSAVGGKSSYTFDADNKCYVYNPGDSTLDDESGKFTFNDKEGEVDLESNDGDTKVFNLNGDYIYATPYIGSAKLTKSDFHVYNAVPSTFKDQPCDFCNDFDFNDDGTYTYTYTVDYESYFLTDLQLLKTYGTYTIDKDNGLVTMHDSDDGHILSGMIKNGTFYGDVYEKND